jgi:protein phosphatase
MASEPNGPTPPASEGARKMLDQIKGMAGSLGGESEEDVLPSFDFPGAPQEVAETLPAAAEVVTRKAPLKARCPCCGADRLPTDTFCGDCGYFYKEPFPTGDGDAIPEAVPLLAPPEPIRVKQRYELIEQTSDRGGVERYKARDLGLSGNDNVPVVVLKQAAPRVEAIAVEDSAAEAVATSADDEILPIFDEPAAGIGPATEIVSRPAWPGVNWERNLLDSIEHPGLPAVLDTFFEGDSQYLVEEVPQGRSLWDAWDDPDATNQQRFGHLVKVAELMQTLHRVGATIEGIRPDIFVITDKGDARVTDLSDLLPLPIPPEAQIRGSLYTAPEVVAAPQTVDPRADLYSFGAMLYALNLGHELTEKQFLSAGNPKPIFNDYPDMHPALGRLLMKTFCRQIEGRFPTDEAIKEDATGFTELIKTLKTCARTMDQCRLEVAAWTTIGMVRTGNEDAFALLHSCESRQDDFSDSALLLLADGMGGYEAGEIAAAMCIANLRKNLTALKPFNSVAGGSGFPSEHPQGENAPPPLDVEEAKRMIKAALKDANKHVFTASRTPGGPGRRGMGCTAEVVYVDGKNVVAGHVGDSRTYILSEGRLIQMTRDQTLVNRLVELGTLSEEEAENHPRKNELQQAIGGQPDVEPGIYSAKLRPGDFVIVCSDGLTNHVKDAMLSQFLKVEAVSAELTARRLVNLVNIEGATDNATVVVVRAT